MDCLWLHIRAPFATFRGFQAGVYRSTSPIMPPSAALGLVLNLAGIEMRDYGKSPNLTIRPDIPCLQLAIGTISNSRSEVCTLYQQLHSYPVGQPNKKKKDIKFVLSKKSHGSKYWIAPVRRELLVGLDMILGIKANEELLEQVKKGLKGELDQPRYGLPFAGDNNFLFDRIDILNKVPETFWYVQMKPDDPPMRGSHRLTVGIDRADNSKTTSFLFAPLETSSSQPPGSAWVWTPREPVTV